MKTLVIALILMIGNMASAKCYNFINGRGPNHLGSVAFSVQGRNYAATKLCVHVNNRIDGSSYSSISLSDKEGDIALLAVKVGVGRCLNQNCLSLSGLSGQALGRNLTPQQAQSVSIIIRTTLQANLGIETGTYVDQASGEQLLISETKNQF